MGKILVILVTAVALAFAGAGVLMLLVGALHSLVPQVPAIGFWASLLVSVIVSFLTGGSKLSVSR